MEPLDFGDPFVNEAHLRASFPDAQVLVDGRDSIENVEGGSRKNYRVRVLHEDGQEIVEATSYAETSFADGCTTSPRRQKSNRIIDRDNNDDTVFAMYWPVDDTY